MQLVLLNPQIGPYQVLTFWVKVAIKGYYNGKKSDSMEKN